MIFFVFTLLLSYLKPKTIENTRNMSKESFLKIFVKMTSLMMTSSLNFQNLDFFYF